MEVLMKASNPLASEDCFHLEICSPKFNDCNCYDKPSCDCNGKCYGNCNCQGRIHMIPVGEKQQG